MPEIGKQLKQWTGYFGRDYTDRNILSLTQLERTYKGRYGVTRIEMNRMFLGKLPRSTRILEVGSNIGNQLICLQKMGFRNLYGIEPQDYAIELSKKSAAGINIMRGDIFDIPFKDEYIDLIFTSGVLIHISPQNIHKAMKEIYRCARRYIWGFEYYSERYTKVVYRGQKKLLWKANFLELYLRSFKDLRIVKAKKFKYLNNDNVDLMFLLKKV